MQGNLIGYKITGNWDKNGYMGLFFKRDHHKTGSCLEKKNLLSIGLAIIYFMSLVWLESLAVRKIIRKKEKFQWLVFKSLPDPSQEESLHCYLLFIPSSSSLLSWLKQGWTVQTYHPSYVHGDWLSLVGFADTDLMDLETWGFSLEENGKIFVCSCILINFWVKKREVAFN